MMEGGGGERRGNTRVEAAGGGAIVPRHKAGQTFCSEVIWKFLPLKLRPPLFDETKKVSPTRRRWNDRFYRDVILCGQRVSALWPPLVPPQS